MGMVSPERKDMNKRDSPFAKMEGIVVVFIPWTTIVLVPTIAKALSISDSFPGNSFRSHSSVSGELPMASDVTILNWPLTLE